MKFEEFIEHKDGTYINVKPTKDNKKELYNWVVDNEIGNPLNRDEYHVTVIYSRNPCPNAKYYDFNLPIEGKICGWEIFDANIGRCLVARIESKQLNDINNDLMTKYGATSDFDSYKPHITVSYDYKGDKPKDIPNINFSFDMVEVKGLDTNWRPKK